MRRSSLAAVLALVLSVGAAHADAPPGGSIEFVASNLVQTANGTFHDWRIETVQVRPDDLAASFAVVVVELASVDTGIESRDDHLRTEDFFHVDVYPTARVRVSGIEPAGAGADGLGRYVAQFDVDLHGVQRTVEGEFEVLSTSPLRVEGAVVIDRLDFGIGEPRSFWNPLSITEEIPIRFRAELPTPAGPASGARP